MGDLILGTAQLGQRYGIANRTGQPDAETIHAIVATAWEHGIHSFDTAPGYGDAERLLGESLAVIGASAAARVTTKLERDADDADAGSVARNVAASHALLGVSRLHGLLVRRTLLPQWAAIAPTLALLREQDVVERVGVSVYTPEEAHRALAFDDVAFVQVPTSILDRRCLVAGVFDRARSFGKRVVVRSVLLQGLLAMVPEEAPPIPGARDALEGMRRASEALRMRPVALALAYVRERCPHSDVLVGAETPAQIAELIAFWGQQVGPCAETIERYVRAGAENLVDPTRWHAIVR